MDDDSETRRRSRTNNEMRDRGDSGVGERIRRRRMGVRFVVRGHLARSFAAAIRCRAHFHNGAGIGLRSYDAERDSAPDRRRLSRRWQLALRVGLAVRGLGNVRREAAGRGRRQRGSGLCIYSLWRRWVDNQGHLERGRDARLCEQQYAGGERLRAGRTCWPPRFCFGPAREPIFRTARQVANRSCVSSWGYRAYARCGAQHA